MPPGTPGCSSSGPSAGGRRSGRNSRRDANSGGGGTTTRRNIAGQNSRQAKGRRRRLERVGRLSPPPSQEGAMALRLAAQSRGGDQVLVLEDVTVSIGARELVHDFSAVVRRGEVGGPGRAHGSGKSRLLRT